MIKSDLSQKLFKTIKHLNKKTLLLTTKLLTVIVACSLLSNSMGLSELSVLQLLPTLPKLPSIKTEAVTVLGSSSLGGSDTLIIDKKYYNGTTEVENISVAPSTLITVRVKYNHFGSQAIQDAQVIDSLPAGFTYQAGSFKNCITPTTPEEVCDSLSSGSKDIAFINLTGSGLSPVSGLYDANSNSLSGGTAITSTSGVMEIGKKSTLHVNQCQYAKDLATPTTDYFGSILSGSYPNPTYNTYYGASGTKADNNLTGTSNCGSGSGATLSDYNLYPQDTGVQDFGLKNTRYIHINQCNYNTSYSASHVDYFTNLLSPSNFTFGTYYGANGTKSDNIATGTSACQPGVGVPDYAPNNNNSGIQHFDILGNRYFHINQCQYYQASPDNDFYSSFINQSQTTNGIYF